MKKETLLLYILFAIAAAFFGCTKIQIDQTDYWDIYKTDLEKNYYSGPVKSVFYSTSNAHHEGREVVIDKVTSYREMYFDKDGYLTKEIDSVQFFGTYIPITQEYSYSNNKREVIKTFDNIPASRRVVKYKHGRPIKVTEFNDKDDLDSELLLEYSDEMLLTRVADTDSTGKVLNERLNYTYNKEGFPTSLEYFDYESDLHKFHTFKFTKDNLLEEKCEYVVDKDGNKRLDNKTLEEYDENKKIVSRNVLKYDENGNYMGKAVTSFDDNQWWAEEATFDAKGQLVHSTRREMKYDDHNNCTEILYYNNNVLTTAFYFQYEYYE